MSPFDQLVQHANRRVERPPVAPARGGRTDALLALLERNGRMCTADLAASINLSVRLTWGLLKAPRDRGQVHIIGGEWELVPDYVPPDVRRAADLLRGLGWAVSPPSDRLSDNT